MKNAILDRIRRSWADVSRERRKSYILSVTMLLVVGLSLVMMEWLYVRSRGYSFAQGLPSPQTYRVISPVKYEDHAATGALRDMEKESVAGVVVRDVAAQDRMKRRLEEIRAVRDARDPKRLPYLPQALLDALIAPASLSGRTWHTTSRCSRLSPGARSLSQLWGRWGPMSVT